MKDQPMFEYIVDIDPTEEFKMNCGSCGKRIGECKCPDMDKRMKQLRNNDSYVYKMCEKCGKHHERCKCEEPVWISSHDAYPLEKCYEAPTLRDMVEAQMKKEEGRLN